MSDNNAGSPFGRAGQIAQQIDLSSLVAALNAFTQTVGANGKTLVNLLNSGFVAVDYYHISGAGTFAVKGTAGTLFSLNINQVGTGGAGTIYDAASPTLVAGSLEVAVLTFGTVAPQDLPMGPQNRGLSLNSGLVIITTGNADITVGFL